MNAVRRLVSALRSPGSAAPGELGLSVAQLFALRIIGQRPGISMGDLAVATLTTPSAVSEVVTRLVRRELVRRDLAPDDRRRAVLRLTPPGAALLMTLGETLPERLIRSLGQMTSEARLALADGLDGWLRGARLHHVAPSMFGEGDGPARDVIATGATRVGPTAGTSAPPAPVQPRD